MQAEIYSTLKQDKVITEASIRSGIPKGSINAAWEAIGDVVRAWTTEGHSVALPGLGTMRFGLQAEAVSKVEDVGTGLITTRKVIFTPSTDIKQELKNTSINITCYDKDGNSHQASDLIRSGQCGWRRRRRQFRRRTGRKSIGVI